MVGAAIVEHGLGGDTVPVGARRGLNKGGHPLSVQAFGLTEVDYVEYHSLQNLRCVCGGDLSNWTVTGIVIGELPDLL